MELIYLDTSTHYLIASAKANNLKWYKSFLQKWNERKYTLAVSGAHIFEMQRLLHGDERARRFELLEELMPFRFEQLLTEKEIVTASKLKGLVMPDIDGEQIRIDLFSHKVKNRRQILELISFDNPAVRELYDLK